MTRGDARRDLRVGVGSLGKEIGARIRAIRKAAGLTIYDVAEKTGYSDQTISQVETASRTISLDHLERICPAIGIEPADLFCPEGAPLTKLSRDVLAALEAGGAAAAMKVLLPVLALELEKTPPS